MVSDKVKVYELDLLYGNDIFYKGLKITNLKLKDINAILFNQLFYDVKKYLSDTEKSKEYNLESTIMTISLFVECLNVEESPFGGLKVTKIKKVFNSDKDIEEDAFEVVMLSDDDIEIIFELIREMYWCRKAEVSTDDKLIDETKAGDEHTLQAIKKWNENQLKYNSNKKESKTTIFSIIERCASLGLGGYNFTTIQDITLYQLKCLHEGHTSDCTFNGYLAGLYSQVDISKVDTSNIGWC